MKTKILTEESGFSLLEMLIAMTILAIGLLGVAVLQISAIQGSAYSIKASQATSHITDTFENLKTTSYANLPAVGSTVKKTIGNYTITTTTSSGPTTGTLTIRVDAEWTDTRPHKIGYRTVFSNF